MYLFCNEQHDALKQLVPVQSGDPHVQEQTIQHWGRNIGQVVQDQLSDRPIRMWEKMAVSRVSLTRTIL